MSTSAPRSIAYVEFNVPDIAAAKAFYGRVFGWTFTDYGPAYAEFHDGRIKGGFLQAGAVVRGGPLVLFQAPTKERLTTMVSEVEAAGGAIVKPIFAYPGGSRFQFTDPAGHELGVFAEELSGRGGGSGWGGLERGGDRRQGDSRCLNESPCTRHGCARLA